MVSVTMLAPPPPLLLPLPALLALVTDTVEVDVLGPDTVEVDVLWPDTVEVVAEPGFAVTVMVVVRREEPVRVVVMVDGTAVLGWRRVVLSGPRLVLFSF